ncbi:ATP-binding protein [Cellulophaga sp. E6(2014)]|uniref:ATP-binding protein n=1 Tax=Cellulophaga sp. E6(2014) TaxID=1495334 RepID=UPI00068BD8AE|nr:ATP-binding protein [Cellulophaga sp. E6(2014)]
MAKKLILSPKLYVVLLIIAAALLTFIGSISYKQISEFKQAANSVTHTLEVETEINNLFAIYSQMESAQLTNLLRKDTLVTSISFQKYIDESNATFKRLNELVLDNPIQQTHLTRIGELQNNLVTALKAIAVSPKVRLKYSVNERNKLDEVSHIMAELNQRKNFMLIKEEKLLKERKEEFNSYAFLSPFMILVLGAFAMFVFVLSFIKINNERKSRSRAEAFLSSVMAKTENIVNFYEPIFNDNGEVTDFKLVYANERNKTDFGLDPEVIVGQPISKIFPFTVLNGEYDVLAQSFIDKKEGNLSRQVLLNGKKIWLESLIRPLNDGLLVIAKNTTHEKESVAKLNTLNLELQEQYEEIKETDEFLQNVIRSTNNVISYFEPILDKEGTIIDFSILYTNEEIKNTTGQSPDELVQKKISEAYPFLMENGVFEFFIEAILTGKPVEFERDYIFNGVHMWFDTYAIKTGDGVCVTSKNISKQKQDEQKILEVNDQLKIQNAILRDAKTLAKIGSYRWDVLSDDEDNSEISDNLYSLLDCEPQEFLPTHENYKKFIHPEDLAGYKKNLKEAIDKKKSVDFSYRIINKSRKIKHFRTTGHFQDNALIGVIQDISTQIKDALKLKEKNQELKRSNEELESFNRVASHDLQEPIRKIQMFISRIEDSDYENLSEKGKEFFTKISSSSERMRMLIKYLLSYSRINKTKSEFTSVSLIEIIDKVQEDLEARIKESGVEIIVDNLPTLNAVPFQMEQLFNNIISNAIKYGGKEDPKIIIDCKKLKRNEIPNNFIKKHKSYYRISIIDNGIGFEQEHADKIFELFQRLHQKTEYSGTGIGLAICKKIAQNHGGHILAESALGKGSTFCVFLPA